MLLSDIEVQGLSLKKGLVRKERWQEKDEKKGEGEELREKAGRRRKSVCVCAHARTPLDYTAPQGNGLH